jgi:PIN domain nuclease of toxin-antitoxin system
VLDSSALLAALWAENGADAVVRRGHSAFISAVNYAEVLAKATDRGAAPDRAEEVLGLLSLAVVPFDREQAAVSASLRRATRPSGLSLGDRACLALAHTRGLPVLTADRAWVAVDIGVTIELIR